MQARTFSKWPEPLGLAAIGDEKLVEQFADNSRQELMAVGIRQGLHPQVDLATEPRWSRISGTFGEDAALTARLATAYIKGYQGTKLGPNSVATMTKHFPGGGPQKRGLDPHFAFQEGQVYIRCRDLELYCPIDGIVGSKSFKAYHSSRLHIGFLENQSSR